MTDLPPPDSTFDTIGLLVVGWLLGTLSPTIVDAVSRHRRRKAVFETAAVELHELRFKTALVLFQNRRAAATVDAETVTIVRRFIIPHKHLPGEPEVGTTTAQLLMMGDDNYIALVNSQGAKSERGGWYPLHTAPFLLAHVADIAALRPDAQLRLSRVLEEIDLYNNQVEYLRELQRLTFTLTGPNHQINAANLTKGHENMGYRAGALITAICNVVSDSGALHEAIK